MTMTLEAKLRELAARGELTHFSLAPTSDGKQFRASYTPASTFGVTFAEHADPAVALMAAFENTKLKRRGSTGLKPTPEPDAVPALDEAYDPAA